MAKSKKAPKKITVDFDDEDSVLAVMAKELDAPVEDLSIEVDEGLGTGDTFYRIELGSKEYFVAENEESANALAVAQVKESLEESPEAFEPNFIESHIDTDRLRRDLESDESNSVEERVREMDADEFWSEARRWTDLEAPESDDAESADLPDPTDSDINKLVEALVEDTLKDPVQYLKDMLGDEDGIKKAIEIGGIDVNAAAEEAVSVDGAGHFLRTYDGHLQNGPDGLVYWRHN